MTIVNDMSKPRLCLTGNLVMDQQKGCANCFSLGDFQQLIDGLGVYLVTARLIGQNSCCCKNVLPRCSLWRWGRSMSLTGLIPACSGRMGRPRGLSEWT